MSAKNFVAYADAQPLFAGIGEKLSERLVKTDIMPVNPEIGAVVLYIGVSTASFTKGGIYQYVAGITCYAWSADGTSFIYTLSDTPESGDNIYDNTGTATGDTVTSYDSTNDSIEVDGSAYSRDSSADVVLGSRWIQLNPSGPGSTEVIEGYYFDGQFYEDASHTVPIVGQTGIIYVDLSGDQAYRYDVTTSQYHSLGSSTSYTAGFGISINDDEIKTTDFVGTQAQWDALSNDQKAAYDFVNVTDDTTNVNYSPGHAISDGTSEKTQREILEFDGFTVTDDSVNGKTKVAEVPYTAGDGVEITEKEISVSDEISRTWTGTKAEWDAIADKSAYDGWIINITDDQASGIGIVVDTVADGNMNAVTSNAVANVVNKGSVEVVADGTKTWGQLIASLHSEIDESKLTKDSVVKYSTSAVTVFFRIVTIGVSWLGFSSVRNTSLPGANSLVCYMLFNTSGSAYTENTNGTAADHTSDVVSADSSLTLYY